MTIDWGARVTTWLALFAGAACGWALLVPPPWACAAAAASATLILWFEATAGDGQ